MIGGGFTGNFPRRPGKDKKPDTTLGVVQGNPNLHASKGFSENEPRVSSASPVASPSHNLNFIGIGPRVTSTPSEGHGNTQSAATPVKSASIEAVWKGIVHGVSGYGKANREIVKRLDSMVKIRFASGMLWNDAEADEEARHIWAAHKWDDASASAPRVTFVPPSPELKSRYRIIYTMMETEVVHPEMIRIMNDNYEECWTPTHWNAQTFRQSGLRLPIYVMPLGVDPAIYTPTLAARMPIATLLTTADAGRSEVPAGFIFVYVFQPSFRKGLDFLLSAFEEAFYADRDVGLLLGTTAYGLSGTYGLPNRNMKTRVWALTGKQTERELAAMYRACHVYICSSRGEGWNLPLCLVEGTEVDTLNGPVPIELIEPGMVVTDHRGDDALVEGVTHRKYEGPVVSIKRMGDSQKVVSDPLHPHLVLRRPYKGFEYSLRAIQRGSCKPEWIKAESVTKGDFMCVPKLAPLSKEAPEPLVISSVVPRAVDAGDGKVALQGSYHTDSAVTLKTVAERLGVGFKHVSKILNRGRVNPGGGRYSQEHVNAVLAAAREVGYERPAPLTVRNVISTTEDVAFFFGLYISEGCPFYKNNGIFIVLHRKETWAADLCQRVLLDEFGVKSSRDVADNKIVIRTTSRILGETFASLFGNGARNKHIPNEWKRSSWVRHVVSGIFYGDGCYHKSPGIRYSFSTSSVRLRNDLLEILNRCGILAHVRKGRDVEQTILIPAQYDVLFYREFNPRKFYSPCLPRHKARYTHIPEDANYFYSKVRSVSVSQFKGTLRNLHVSHGNSFTIRGMATHNCEAAACGLPVIAPRTSVHPELIPSGYGFFFEQDGYQTYPEAIKVSKWFEGTPFPQYGAGSKRALVELLRLMRNEYSSAQVIGKRFSAYVRSRYTWGASARLIGERIKALCI